MTRFALLVLLILAGCVHAPSPTPKPPEPTPVAPVVDPSAPKGFRVLIIYQTEANNSREQLGVINSPTVRKWLSDNCAKGPDGRSEWRLWDADIEFAGTESKDMVDLFRDVQPKLSTLPALVTANGPKAKVQPLPVPESTALEVLKGAKQ